MKRILKRLLLGLLILLLTLVAAIMLLPWERQVEQRLVAALEAQGMKPAKLTIAGIGWHGLKVTDVALGEPAHHFDQLELGYAPLALLQHKSNAPLHLSAQNLTLHAGETPLHIAALTADIAPQQSLQHWQGKWQLEGITLAADTANLPPFSATGTLEATREKLQIEGSLSSKDNSYHGDFTLHYLPADKAASTLHLRAVSLPWGGGTIALTEATLPLGGDAPIRLPLQVKQVALQPLMETLAAGKATATGNVSGALPIRLTRSGDLFIEKSTLAADAPGLLTLSPEVIPGDNPALSIARNVLSNLHYTTLALALEMQGAHALGAELKVEGSNPAVENGRPIKLTVHLSGDVLNLLRQNITLLNDPARFIQQGNHD